MVVVYFKVPSRLSPGDTETNHETLHSGQLVTRPSFEPGNLEIYVTATPTCSVPSRCESNFYKRGFCNRAMAVQPLHFVWW